MRRHPIPVAAIALLSLLSMACGEPLSPAAPAASSDAIAASAAASLGRATRDAKVTVCHRSGTESEVKAISIAAEAVEAHINHGDALPGQAVPGQSGMVFDSQCRPIAAREVTTSSGNWNGVSYAISGRFTMGVAGVVDASATVSGFSDPMRLALLGYDPNTNTCSTFFLTEPFQGDAMTPPVITAHWDNVPAGTYCLNVVQAAPITTPPAPYSWTATIIHPF